MNWAQIEQKRQEAQQRRQDSLDKNDLSGMDIHQIEVEFRKQVIVIPFREDHIVNPFLLDPASLLHYKFLQDVPWMIKRNTDWEVPEILYLQMALYSMTHASI